MRVSNRHGPGIVSVQAETDDCAYTVQAAIAYGASQGSPLDSVAITSASYRGPVMELEFSSPAQTAP